MKLKSFFSILLILLVGHGCKQVYEVEVPQTSSNEPFYHVAFVNKSIGDKLGVIVSDTSKRDISFFFGDKNAKGNLINVQQIVSYLPKENVTITFELNEELFPQKITGEKNDTTFTIQFKNYDLTANTVDFEIFDTNNILVHSRKKAQ